MIMNFEVTKKEFLKNGKPIKIISGAPIINNVNFIYYLQLQVEQTK